MHCSKQKQSKINFIALERYLNCVWTYLFKTKIVHWLWIKNERERTNHIFSIFSSFSLRMFCSGLLSLIWIYKYSIFAFFISNLFKRLEHFLWFWCSISWTHSLFFLLLFQDFSHISASPVCLVLFGS